MGSPVSPVVANLCMEEIEESAINSSSVPPKIWKRYVDDNFCIIKKDNVPAFHDTLNSIDANISFTIEIQSDNKISFLDTLVTRRNGAIVVDVYRKPTHTDRYLDYNSHHDNKHKASTAATLLHRALELPNSSDGKNENLTEFIQHLNLMVIHRISLKTSRPTKPDAQQCCPRRNLLEHFSRWSRRPNHASRSPLFHTLKA